MKTMINFAKYLCKRCGKLTYTEVLDPNFPDNCGPVRGPFCGEHDDKRFHYVGAIAFHEANAVEID